MYKAIICDFGGVIGTDVDIIIDEIFQERGLSQELAASVWKKHWPKLKLGAEPVNNYWFDLSQSLGDEALVQSIREETTSRMRVYGPVLQYLSSFRKKGFILAILSNESVEWMDVYREKGWLNDAFDKLYVSGELGMAKPQKEFYELVLDNYDLAPNETIFIDNMLRNTDAAEALGIKGIIYESLDQLKSELANLGLK